MPNAAPARVCRGKHARAQKHFACNLDLERDNKICGTEERWKRPSAPRHSDHLEGSPAVTISILRHLRRISISKISQQFCAVIRILLDFWWPSRRLAR